MKNKCVLCKGDDTRFVDFSMTEIKELINNEVIGTVCEHCKNLFLGKDVWGEKMESPHLHSVTNKRCILCKKQAVCYFRLEIENLIIKYHGIFKFEVEDIFNTIASNCYEFDSREIS